MSDMIECAGDVDSARARGLDSALRVLWWAWMVTTVMTGAMAIAVEVEVRLTDAAQLRDALERLFEIDGALALGASLVTALAIGRIADTTTGRTAALARRAAWLAWAALALMVVERVVAHLRVELLEQYWLPVRLGLSCSHALAETAMLVVLVTGLTRIDDQLAAERAPATRALQTTAIIAAALLPLAWIQSSPLPEVLRRAPREVLELVTGVLFLALLSALSRRLRPTGASALPAPSTTPDGPYRVGATAPSVGWEGLPGWQRAADGLRRYRAAIVWRVGLGVALAMLLVAALLARQPQMVIVVGIAFWAASLVISIVQVAALARYTILPRESGGREAAVAALCFAAATVGSDLGVLFVVLSGGGSASQRLTEAAFFSQVLGGAALVSLLVSFARTARRIQAPVIGRVWTVLGLSVVSAALVEVFQQTQSAIVGLPLLVTGLTALVLFLSLLRAMADAMSPPA